MDSSDKQNFFIKESKTFCMLPWIHIHTTPSGLAAPCCIAESTKEGKGVGNTATHSLMEIVNGPKMNELRKNMLDGIFPNDCKSCHRYDEKNIVSPRKAYNDYFKDYLNESLENTNSDGSLKEFKMRYFDIRFNNICNFKCRTCNASYSSQWEQENMKHIPGFIPIPKNNKPLFLQEIVDQIPNMKVAYFAGGEPLITEQHYTLLEEMIRTGESDNIILRYNTNLSHLNFKDKDLIQMWSKFKHSIELHVSIDHCGERAEYIRHGTDWGLIESNIMKVKKMPNVFYHINTVLSVFNLLTIDKFYEYMNKKNLFTSTDRSATLYPMSSPEQFTCHVLPEKYKQQGIETLNRTNEFMTKHNYSQTIIDELQKSALWVKDRNLWDEYGKKFKREVVRVDDIRGESFRKTFPELEALLDLN